MNPTEPAAEFKCQTCFASFPSEAHLEVHIDAYLRLISFLMEKVHKAASHLIPLQLEEPVDDKPPQPDVFQMCPLPACTVLKPLSQMKWHFAMHSPCFESCPGCGVTYSNADRFLDHANECDQIGVDPAKAAHSMRKQRALIQRAAMNLKHATDRYKPEAAEGQDGSAEPHPQNHPRRDSLSNDQQSHSIQPDDSSSHTHASPAHARHKHARRKHHKHRLDKPIDDECMNEPLDKSEPKRFKEGQEGTAEPRPQNHPRQNAFSDDLQSQGLQPNAFPSHAFPSQRQDKGPVVMYSSLSETAALHRTAVITDNPQPQPDNWSTPYFAFPPASASEPGLRPMQEPVPESASKEPVLSSQPSPPPPAEDHLVPPSAMMPPFCESEFLLDAFPPES